VTRRLIMRTRFEVKRSRSLRPNNDETESESELQTFKLGRRMVHALSTAVASYKGLCSWVIARGQGHTVSAALGDGHTTCLCHNWNSELTFYANNQTWALVITTATNKELIVLTDIVIEVSGLSGLVNEQESGSSRRGLRWA